MLSAYRRGLVTEAHGGNTFFAAGWGRRDRETHREGEFHCACARKRGRGTLLGLLCSSGGLFAVPGAGGRRRADVIGVRCHVCSAPR